MPEYDSWEALTAAAQEKCKTILTKDVAPIAKEIVKRHIQTDIYDVYTPIPNGWVNGTTYRRRYALGKSVYYSLVADDEIMITSNAAASKSVIKGYSFHNRRPGSFFKLLETGRMGIWRHGFPRPAISNAQAEIDRSRAVRSAIEDGLKRQFN